MAELSSATPLRSTALTVVDRPSLDYASAMQKTTILVVLMLVACRRHAHHDDELPAPQANLMGTVATGVIACLKTDVLTHGGCVRGQAGTIEAYRGIPYAAPPVGPLRWKPPQPVAAWKDARPATAFGKACPQLDDVIGAG